MSQLAAVVIGRNEGKRLTRCLQAHNRAAVPTVYVDAGATDGSVEHARSLGADIVEPDCSLTLSAARARNAGIECVQKTLPGVAHDMAWHDANSLRCGQWWRWMVRRGYVYAQGCALYGCGPERFCVPDSISIWLWGLVIPLVVLGHVWPSGGWSLCLFLLYLWPIFCVTKGRYARGEPTLQAAMYGSVACSQSCRIWLN